MLLSCALLPSLLELDDGVSGSAHLGSWLLVRCFLCSRGLHVLHEEHLHRV